MNKYEKEAAGRAWTRYLNTFGLREASPAERASYFAGFAAALSIVKRAQRGERFK